MNGTLEINPSITIQLFLQILAYDQPSQDDAYRKKRPALSSEWTKKKQQRCVIAKTRKQHIQHRNLITTLC